jgi:hypothetical protein
MTLQEIWKEIPGYNSQYQISNHGTVYSKHLARCLKPYGNGTKKNYQKVKLTAPDGTKIQRYLHELVMTIFVRPLNTGEETNHVDNNTSNNDLRNLEIVTKKGNAAHKLLNRLFVFETVAPLHEQFFSTI